MAFWLSKFEFLIEKLWCVSVDDVKWISIRYIHRVYSLHRLALPVSKWRAQWKANLLTATEEKSIARTLKTNQRRRFNDKSDRPMQSKAFWLKSFSSNNRSYLLRFIDSLMFWSVRGESLKWPQWYARADALASFNLFDSSWFVERSKGITCPLKVWKSNGH